MFKKVRGLVHVLLVFNGKNWSIPKGARSERESKRKAAARELREETGIRAPKKLAYVGVVRKDKNEVLTCYSARGSGQRPKPLNEITAARFVKLSRARKLVERYQAPLLHAFLKKSKAAC